MQIAVFGASGGCGRLVVELALRDGHTPIAITRRPRESPPPAIPRTCSPYTADGLAAAIDGAEAVISCIGIRRRSPLNPWSPLASPPDTAAVCTANILDAMQHSGINRIACISAAGVAESRSACTTPIRALIERTNLRPAYDDLEQMEQALAASDTTWLALRPTTLISLGSAKPPRPTTRYALFSITPRRAVARALLDFATGNARAHTANAMVTG
ncbi:MAG: NAD(P)H-binding protein [Planctomycetota bacterium]